MRPPLPVTPYTAHLQPGVRSSVCAIMHLFTAPSCMLASSAAHKLRHNTTIATVRTGGMQLCIRSIHDGCTHAGCVHVVVVQAKNWPAATADRQHPYLSASTLQALRSGGSSRQFASRLLSFPSRALLHPLPKSALAMLCARHLRA